MATDDQKRDRSGGWTPMHPPYPVPIRIAPNLDPADAVHVPRWLDELAEVERKAEATEVIERARAARDKVEAARRANREAEAKAGGGGHD